MSAFGEQTGLTNPSWLDDNRVLGFGGHFRQVNVDSPGGGNDDALYWFDDAGNEDVGDGELSRQGDRLALVRSYGDDTHLAIYHVAGGAGGAAPEASCFTGKDATLAGPSWSPDGTKLAFQDEEGVEVLPLPHVVAGDCPGASSSAVVLAGASAPDWGPAAIGSGAGTYVAPTPPAPVGTGNNATPTPTVKRARLQASVPRSVSLAAAAARGVLIHARGSATGRVTASLQLGRRPLATAGVHASAGARLTLSLRLTRASVKLLRRAHASRVTVTVSLIPASGPRTASTSTVHLTHR